MQLNLETVIITDYENGYIIEKKTEYSWNDSLLKQELENMGIFFYYKNDQAIKVNYKTPKDFKLTLGFYKQQGKTSIIVFPKKNNQYEYEFNYIDCGNMIFLLNKAFDYCRDKKEELENDIETEK